MITYHKKRQNGAFVSYKTTTTAVLYLLVVSFIVSCSPCKRNVVESRDFMRWTSDGAAPKIVAVLPFMNETRLKGLDQSMRENFYQYFSIRPFHDVEIKEVDEALKKIETNEAKACYEITPEKLGNLLGCDALVYGKVTRYKRLYLLIYTQTLIEAEIKVVETASGNELWKHTLTKRFHEGGVPTSPLGVIPAAVRTTYSLRKDRRNRNVDNFCKDFVKCVPEFQSIQTKSVDASYAVHIASFKLRKGALDICSTLGQEGYKPVIEEIDNGGVPWYRVKLGDYPSRAKAEQQRLAVEAKFSFLHPTVVNHE